jgi:hypothetical protein
MTERTHIPSSPACGRWETLLADALDGQLRPEDEAAFTTHMAGCAHCTALFDEARKGREWLNFLTAPEVPEGLVDRILAQTGPGNKPGHLAVAGHAAAMPVIPAWQRPGFMGHVRRFAEPRLMMTTAMAFFSIALTLNLTGLRFTQLRLADLRPTAIRATLERRLTMASVPIVRYYDHLRFVYEVESRMRELRGDSEGNQQDQDNQKDTRPAGPGESKQNRKDGGTHIDPPQQSSKPETLPSIDTFNDFLETSLNLQGRPSAPAVTKFRRASGSAHSGGSAMRARERSRLWTA